MSPASRFSVVSCAGAAHRYEPPVELDLHATSGPRRVALLEDGAAFCRRCAWEITRSEGRSTPG